MGNVCLSTNHCQDISRETAVTLCVALGCGSEVWESRDPPVSGLPMHQAGTRGLTPTAHQRCFPVGSSSVQLSATSGTHFLGGPEGEFCIPGIKFSLQWLRGQLVGVFK